MKRLAALAVLLFALVPFAARAQSSSTPLSSFAALKGVALNQSDLIGYSLVSEHDAGANAPQGLVAAYFGVWSTATPTLAVIGDNLIATDSVSVAQIAAQAAHDAVAQDSLTSQLQDLGSQGVGDADDEIAFQVGGGASSAAGQAYQETARFGVIVVSVQVVGNPGAFSALSAVAYVRTIAGRVAAQGAGPTQPSTTQPSPSPSPTSPPQPAPAAQPALIMPALQPQGVVDLAGQYAASNGYTYAGDCSLVTAADAGALCSLIYGPDASGNYAVSYSIVGSDGTPGAPYGPQTVTPAMAIAAYTAARAAMPATPNP